MGSLCFKSTGSESSTQKHEEKGKELNLVTEKDKTLLKLKMCKDDLNEKIKSMGVQREKSIEEIKKYMAQKMKEMAMFALKRKKLYEQFSQDYETRKAVIQRQILEVEKTIMNEQLVGVMGDAVKILQDAEKQNEKLVNIMDETKETEYSQKQVANAFAEMGGNDSQVEEEYNKLEADMVKAQFLQVDTNPIVVQVPQNVAPVVHVEQREEPQNVQKEKEDKLKMLAELA